MKKLITITVAFLAIVSMNAQELCSFNPNNELGLGSDFNYNTTLYAGKIIGKTNSIVCTVGANDMYQSWSYSFSAGNGFIKGGLQGQTNPTDVNGEKPSKTLLPPVNGAFLSFEAKADGWLSVLLFASSHKAYTVFEDGKAIGYTFGAIGNASSDLGAVYQFAIQGEGQNNEVKNPIEFAEQEFLKATAPSKYNARWSWDAEGNMTWNQIKINGRGVIKFHVKKGGKYIVNANGSKMTAVGFCFDTHGNTVIKADGTTILPAGTGFYNKRTIHVATAGTLPNLIEDDEKYHIEELTLTGELDGDDLGFLREMAGQKKLIGKFDVSNRTTIGSLEILDISNVNFIAGGCYFADESDTSPYDWDYCYLKESNTLPDVFCDCKKLKKIILPNCVTSIGSSAFANCSHLYSITIPNSVTSIGYYAFKNCGNLYSITIPNSVTSIDSYAFSDCANLYSITIPNSVTSIGVNAFYDTEWYNNKPNGLVYAGKVAYKYKGNMSANTSITINNGTNGIADYAFSGCSGLVSISIPNSVTSIGANAFQNCTGLVSIDIPNGVMSIAPGTFSGCSGLKSVTIPKSVKSIYGAFSGCNSLTAVHISNIKAWCEISFGSYDFNPLCYAHHLFLNGTEIKDLVIPDDVTSIGDFAFGDCSGLTSVTIGNGVTSIGNRAFLNCSNLTSVHITDLKAWLEISFPYGDPYSNPLYYAHHLYINGVEIKNLIIPDGVTTIGDYTFYGCSGLTSVTIPNSVTKLGSAFADCTGLTSVNITDLRAWLNIKFSSNPLYYAHHLYLNGEEIKDLVIPDGITTIGDYAFYGCSGLTSVTIPDNVISIGNSAFKGCTGLTSLTIPRSMITISSAAFQNCSGLASVTIPNSVNSIGTAFAGCSGLSSFTIPKSITSIDNWAFAGCSGLTSIAIPDGVTSIGEGAFSDCNSLTSVIIPNSVESIRSYSFSGCSGLSSIFSLNNTPPTCSYAFYNFDKENCVLWVPKGSVSAYKQADGWKDFQIIREVIDGDVNLDGEVNHADLDASVDFIMGKAPEGFCESLADLNGDDKVNAADVVKLVTILNLQEGLSMDYQAKYSNQVISSLSCTLNNDGDKAIQLTKCELYYNQSLVGSANFKVTLASGGSKNCSFDDLASYSTKTGFSVVWYYTYNGDDYTYRCEITE